MYTTDDQEHGSFLSGFTIGLFAGAAGYFLFGTQRGTQVRKAVVKEWEVAKAQLVDEGVIESKDTSMREFLRDVTKQFLPESTNQKPKHKKVPTTTVTKPKSPQKFKGT